MEEIKSKRAGLVRCIKVSCSYFKLDSYMNQGEGTSYREKIVTSNNCSFAFGSDVAGLDFDQLRLLCSILDIPGPPDSFDTLHQRVIHQTLMEHI